MSRLFAVLLLSIALVGLVATGPAAAQAGAQPASQTIAIDFEEFAKGAIVSEVRSPGSERTIHVHGVNPGFPKNAAVIFDSSEPGPEDPDLGSPNRDFQVSRPDGNPAPGPGRGEGGVRGAPCQNDRPLNKILIVDDDVLPLTEDGRVEIPNDEGRAGARLQLDFSELGPVTIHGLAVIDVEEPAANVWFYNVGIEARKAHPRKKQVVAQYRVHTEDNGVARIFDPALRNVPEEGCYVNLEYRRQGEPLAPLTGVKSIEVEFNGSGAIARVLYSIPPAGESSPARSEG